ncbi:MAG: tyrosinase family protein [Luteolibacter sp.]
MKAFCNQQKLKSIRKLSVSILGLQMSVWQMGFRKYIISASWASITIFTGAIGSRAAEGEPSVAEIETAPSREGLNEKWTHYLEDKFPYRDSDSLRDLILSVQRTRPNLPLPEPLQRELTVSPPKRLSLVQNTRVPFIQPKDVFSNDGHLYVTLNVNFRKTKIGTDDVELRLYNDGLTGPTLHCHPRDLLHIKLVNSLPEEGGPSEPNTLRDFNTTNLHFHGLHVSPAGKSDNVLLDIPPGKSFDYEVAIPANHPCGTFWYHAHRHGSVAAQTSSGMAGAILVEGDQDEIPEIKAAGNQLMILQQIPFKTNERGVGVIEPADVKELFGPGYWDRSGRFTTINGTVLPLIEMSPGQVVRWRVVNSGFREAMRLRMIKNPLIIELPGPSSLEFQEIAVDGIPLGKKKARGEIELWPGYRSDVLIQAPLEQTEYLLADERVQQTGLEGPIEGNRKYLARILVHGPPRPMSLPTNAALEPFRPKSIQQSEVTGDQEMTYGVITENGKTSFTINGKSYDMNRTRLLPLGATERWTLHNKNIVDGQISTKPIQHPFHIHTNAFEVFSVLNEDQRETLLDENGNIEPVWRDTIVVKNGYTVQFRTRYEDYEGAFVQHCHILDHEDLGMMENLLISKEPAKSKINVFTAPPLLQPYGGGVLLATVVRSVKCSSCQEQIRSLARFAKEIPAWPRTIIVAPDSKEEISTFVAKESLGPLQIISDSKSEILQTYIPGSLPGMHAVLLIDKRKRMIWSQTGEEPIETDEIIRQVEALKQSKLTEPPGSIQPVNPHDVSIEIRNSSSSEDDYLTWAPTPSQIKLNRPAAEDLTVVLTNDREELPQKALPLNTGGDVVFATAVAHGKTADRLSLSLRLPKDGTSVPFILAGRYGHPSTRDKDCVIEVHEGSSDGPIIGRHALMVRVRKDADKLDEGERRALLTALHRLDLGFPEGIYRQQFVEMHILASGRDKMNPWPDQAHMGSGFPPWHRAFGLELERQLQRIDPSVTIPYWRMDSPSGIFNADFLGSNRISPEIEEGVEFSEDNPLFGWSATLRNPTAPQLLKRGGRNHSLLPATEPTGEVASRPFQTEEEIIGKTNYREFRAQFEPNPHNVGHVWLGGRWSHGCLFPAADPIFWMFHCNLDRLWAKWQWKYNKFEFSGQDDSHYSPLGSFDPAGDITMGHYLQDTMWPWDGTSGFQIEGNHRARRPDRNPFAPFAKALLPGLWPNAPAHPRPADMIDYLGQVQSSMELGFCFDDIPYGKSEAPPLTPLSGALLRSALMRTVQDPTAGNAEKIEALVALPNSGLNAVADELAAVARDATASTAIRSAALSRLMAIPSVRSADMAAEFSKRPQPPELRRLGVQWLTFLMDFGTEPPGAMGKVEVALDQARADDDPQVTREVLIKDLRSGSPAAFLILERMLQRMVKGDNGPFVLSLTEALKFSAAVRSESTVALLRLLLHDTRPIVAAEAAKSLMGEPSSLQDRVDLLAQRTAPPDVRESTLLSLIREKGGFAALALKIATDPDESVSLRAKAVSGFRVSVESGTTELTTQQLQDAIQQFRNLADTTTVERIEKVVIANVQLLEDEQFIEKSHN